MILPRLLMPTASPASTQFRTLPKSCRNCRTVAVYAPDMRHTLFFEIGMNALAEVDQAVLAAAGEPEQFQFVLGEGRIRDKLGVALPVQ